MRHRSEKPVTGQNVENHHFCSLFFIRFYDFYSLSASLLPPSFLYSSLFSNDYTFTQQIFCPKHLWGQVIPWVGNQREGSPVNSKRSLVRRFGLAVIVCWKQSSIFAMMTQRLISLSDRDAPSKRFGDSIRASSGHDLPSISGLSNCQSWPSTECLYRFLALLQQESSSNHIYYCTLHCWPMVQRAM
jgi:hypothetical protein